MASLSTAGKHTRGSKVDGMSAAIKQWLDTIRDRGQRAIVWDPKGEYLERYYRPGHDTVREEHQSR